MNITKIMTECVTVLKKNPIVMLITVFQLIATALFGALSAVIGTFFVDLASPVSEGAIATIVTNIPLLLFGVFIGLVIFIGFLALNVGFQSAYFYMVNKALKKKVVLKDALTGFKKFFWRLLKIVLFVIGVWILVAILFGISAIVARIVPLVGIALFALAVLAGIVWLVIQIFGLFFVVPVLFKENCSAKQAILKSFAFAKNKWKITLLSLVCIIAVSIVYSMFISALAAILQGIDPTGVAVGIIEVLLQIVVTYFLILFVFIVYKHSSK